MTTASRPSSRPLHPRPRRRSIRSHRFSLLATLAAALLAVPPAAGQQPAIRVDEATVAVTTADGTPAVSLAAGDLAVSEAGAERQVLEVRPEGRAWRLVVYLDAPLAAPRTLARASRALDALSRELTELGTVEVVLAGARPRQLLAPSRDPVAISAVLSRTEFMERGEDRLLALRREAVEEIGRAADDEERQLALAVALLREAELVRERQDALLAWMTESSAGEGVPPEGPNALLYVGDGFDLDPLAFWRGRETVPRAALPPADLPLPDLAAANGELASTAAALGWALVPVALRGDDAELAGRFATPEIEDEPVDGGIIPEGGGVTVRRRRTAAERAEAEIEAERRRRLGPPPLPAEPHRPLAEWAAESGGRLVTAIGELPDLIADLAARWRVRYVTGPAEDAAAAELVAFEVAARAAGLGVAAPRWTAHGTPPAVSALRARRLLGGDLDPGEMSVRAALAFTAPAADGSAPAAASPASTPAASRRLPAEVEVRVEPSLDGVPPVAGNRRLTLAAVSAEGEEPHVLHLRVAGEIERRSAEGGAAGGWSWRGGVELPADVERVAVVVEAADGAWGGTVAGLFDGLGGVGADGWDVAAGLLPAPKPVHLMRPPGQILTGEVYFETVVGPAVRRVVFSLDGRRRASVERPPFAATLDLGRLPLTRRVEVVGYGDDGSEVGRDELLVNGGGGRLAARITEPEGPRAVGLVDVGADVEVPEGARLDRVELYWRDRLVATLFQPPFRQRVRIPGDDAEGFLRVVARLADGTVAEDVRYLNGPLAAERVDVRLTELYVVVTDRNGRPVRDLAADDFVVREDGRRQTVETFGDAGELPLTVGLAVDSSASMFVKLADVQQAAADFLAGLKPGRDRAFLVDFDDDVRLAAPPTRDLDDVGRAGFRLAAGGRTSLWKAIVFSLVQLQAAPGRRALVVYSDGADEDQDFSYRTALDFARKVGVPIYVIVSNDEAVRTGRLPFGFPSLGQRLERLTGEVGGRVWLVRRGDDLSAIYRLIQSELSAQYLLGYYPRQERRDGWRRVEVEVRRRGLEARTLAGYQR